VWRGGRRSLPAEAGGGEYNSRPIVRGDPARGGPCSRASWVNYALGGACVSWVKEWCTATLVVTRPSHFSAPGGGRHPSCFFLSYSAGSGLLGPGPRGVGAFPRASGGGGGRGVDGWVSVGGGHGVCVTEYSAQNPI